MGVIGLWRLLDATGKPVPLETLEGKVLAIDVSIWIYQVLQGYQDHHGHSKPNAHLLGLFHRICKLLYYKIKPVFVFDGGVPMLKKNTIASRRKQKSIATSKAQKMKTDLINNLIKHTAVKTVLNPNDKSGLPEISPNSRNKPTVNDMFKLPDMPGTSKAESSLSDEYDSDSSTQLSPRKQTKWMGNIHNVDVSSAEFKSLPADVRYDILTDLKETRKQNSWGRLHEMPDETHEFSGFQMKRLLKRRLVQESLESAEKEMGGKTLTLEELEKLLTEQGITTTDRDSVYRIAGDSTTRLIYISDKNALIKSSSNETNSESEGVSNDTERNAEAIAGPSKAATILEDMNEYEFNDDWDSDVELTTTSNSVTAMENTSEYEIDSDIESIMNETEMNESRPLAKKYFGKNRMNPALTYMLEYSGLTQKQILTLLEQNKTESDKNTEKNSKALQKNDTCKTKIFASKDNVPNNEESSISKDNTEFQKIFDRTKAAGSASVRDEKTLEDSSKHESFQSDLKSNDISCKIVDSNVVPDTGTIEKLICPKIKATETTVDSISDSDSDDFIEIQDVPIPDAQSVNKNLTNNGIQIMFRSDQKIENDIFADIFQTTQDNLNVTLESDDSTNKAPQNVSIERLEKEVTPEKSIPKSAEEQVQEKQLPNAAQENDSEKHPADNDEIIADIQCGKNHLQEEKLSNVEKVGDSEKCSTDAVAVQDEIQSELNTSIDDSKKPSPLPVNEDELLSLKAQLEDDQEELRANIGKLERQATAISDQIRTEAQELLRLFGIPYVVAPMEAEAQCAYLEQIHLTDGTITDDSDIWLFGGQCVYKNFFNNNKRVLQFRASDIHHHFKLTRNEMIQLALLVGSDYTSGLTGIGPVTALEILAAFPAEGDNLLRGLANFCSWIKSGKAPGPGRTGLRNKVRNVQIEKGFPSQAVVQAYLFPTVDESKEGFTWGKPNLVLLSDYTRLKFGWPKAKFDEVMKPVLKRLEENKSQRAIHTYFNLQSVPKSIEMSLSKRIQKAVRKLNNEDFEDPVNPESSEEQNKKSKPKSTNEKRKKLKEAVTEQDTTESIDKPTIFEVSGVTDQKVEEYIPQREKGKVDALKKKLHAIEVLRKSKKGLNKTRKVKRCVRKVKKEAELSESDSSS